MEKTEPWWVEATLVNCEHMPWRQAWASRKQLQRGLFVVPFDEESEQAMRVIMPVSWESVATPKPVPASIAYAELRLLNQGHIGSWWDCFTDTAKEQLQDIILDLTKDEEAAARGYAHIGSGATRQKIEITWHYRLKTTAR